MAIKAYVLITAEMGKVKEVLGTLRASPVVRSADAVTGPYDLIATLEADDVDTLGRWVTGEIQRTPGLERTLTCIVVNR